MAEHRAFCKARRTAGVLQKRDVGKAELDVIQALNAERSRTRPGSENDGTIFLILLITKLTMALFGQPRRSPTCVVTMC
jgi:hypothetical protein